jgi:hypothetical protein
MGVSHEEIWEKKPHLLSHMKEGDERRWGEGFFNISVDQIGHLYQLDFQPP